ncbi:oligosaccharide flippase family protein [Hydrogenimonas sp. SS33]|uniref:lipopolysaccharide biosynthesis protein n=1 Tax=Hydrogenimonas leucolamina TaxID=2954236 RepID=UPI00336BE70F
MKNFIKGRLQPYKKFLGNVSVVLVANVIKIALGVVLIPIYVRYITPGDLGKFDLIMSAVPILNQIISMGLTNSINKFYLAGHNRAYLVYIQKKLVRHTLLLSGMLLLIYLLTYTYSRHFISFSIFLLALSLLVLENASVVQLRIYALHENFKRSSTVSIVKDLIRYTSLILLVLFMEDKLLALFLGNLVSWAYLFFQTRKDNKVYLGGSAKLTEEQIAELKAYAFPLLFLGLSGFFYLSLDRIMVGMFADSIDQVGYLGIAQRFTTVLALGLGSIGTVLGIRMFKTDNLPELLKIQNRYILFLALLITATLFGYILFKKWVIHFLLTDRYEAAFPIGILLLMSLFWNKSRENVEYLFLVKGETAVISKIFVFFTLLNMTLNYFFILKYNALGAVIATNIAFFLHMSVLLFMAHRENHKINLLPYWTGIGTNLFAVFYLAYT